MNRDSLKTPSLQHKSNDGKKDEDSSDDSVIIDQDKDNFTHEIMHMKGSPLPFKVKDMLREDAI